MILKTQVCLVLSFFSCAALTSCVSYSKYCFSDGVCEITKDGQLSYEGEPGNITEHIAKKEARQQQKNENEAKRQKIYDSAPRRAKKEPITVAVIFAGFDKTIDYELSPELYLMANTYQDLLANSLRKINFLAVTDNSKVNNQIKNINLTENDSKTLIGDKITVQKIESQGVTADIYIFLTLGSNTDIKSGKGLNKILIPTIKPTFNVTMLSRFAYKPLNNFTIGISTTDLVKASPQDQARDVRDGVKFKRDANKDKPSLDQLSMKLGRQINKNIRPELPDLATVNKLDGKKIEVQDNPMNIFKDLFK